MHGVASILYRIFKNQFDSLPSFFQWGLTFVFINITWVFFRANSVDSAIQLLQQVVIGGWTFDINAALTESLMQPTFISVFSRILSFEATILLTFASALLLVTVSRNSNEKTHEFHASVSNLLITYFLLVISILSLSGVSSFLYTNF